MPDTRERKGLVVLEYSLLTNVLLTIMKAVVGLYSRSQAMLSDATHSLSDILSTTINMVALKIAGRPADANHHYGHGRAETVAAKVVALLILSAGIGIGISSFNCLREGTYQSPHLLVLLVALISFLVKELMYRYSMKASYSIGSKALLADAKHHRSDALSSLVVVLGISGSYLGYHWLDPVAGLVVALLILKLGGDLYWQSIQELVDTAPDEETLQLIKEACIRTKGVMKINELRARMHGSCIYVDLRLCVPGDLPLVKGHRIAHQASKNIKDSLGESTQVLVHIDPCYGGDEDKGRVF